MTYEEAVQILESITELYPKFTITEQKAQLLIPMLTKMNYRQVMAACGLCGESSFSANDC
ncbi:hypothetical protein [Salinibacillus xinjiangensis]|uniref:Uncharacterized protein n=1 Tax=Salinibacillus xinjiangensis TaxID=1229268 RepID=A0A6G1X9S0_9BACI|nr:hypothetical protein [Salinibacillus xinjiangensis]MRG87620.1 hypothetical protein [Salinibacillus xinjiangensis]